MNFPAALEGALKLKEISYIHAEGLPAAEMKHGPIALIDDGMPVVVIAPQDHTYEKVLSNIEEVKSRKGRVIAVVSEGDTEVDRIADEVLYVPSTEPLLSPLVTSHPAAIARLPLCGAAGAGRGQAAEPGEVGHGGVTLSRDRRVRVPRSPERAPCGRGELN